MGFSKMFGRACREPLFVLAQIGKQRSGNPIMYNGIKTTQDSPCHFSFAHRWENAWAEGPDKILGGYCMFKNEEILLFSQILLVCLKSNSTLLSENHVGILIMASLIFNYLNWTPQKSH